MTGNCSVPNKEILINYDLYVEDSCLIILYFENNVFIFSLFQVINMLIIIIIISVQLKHLTTVFLVLYSHLSLCCPECSTMC